MCPLERRDCPKQGIDNASPRHQERLLSKRPPPYFKYVERFYFSSHAYIILMHPLVTRVRSPQFFLVFYLPGIQKHLGGIDNTVLFDVTYVLTPSPDHHKVYEDTIPENISKNSQG